LSFDDLINRIPANIHARTKSFISGDIAVFKPEKYVIESKIRMNDYHFIIFHSTPPIARVGGRELQFKKGSLVSLEPGTEITVYPHEKNQLCQYISISVKKNFAERIALEAFGRDKIKFDKLENAYSRQLIESINNFEFELTNFGNKYPIMLQSIATQIAFLLLRDTFAGSQGYSEMSITNDDDYVAKAIDYMKKYYSCSITIDGICRAIYLSPSYFSRMFKNKTGMTPYKFLLELRLAKAKELLSESGFSIEEASRLCGFANSAHLSTAFKGNEGLSPSEYIKQFQNIHTHDMKNQHR
jgi:AraC family transcriptional regulator